MKELILLEEERLCVSKPIETETVKAELAKVLDGSAD
jgi:hypothetical protein